MNAPSDQALIARIEANGFSLSQLFLIGGSVYQSKDAGDFRATSEYGKYPTEFLEESQALVSLLRRQSAPEYESLEELREEISVMHEWEALYVELLAILEKHGKHDPFGDGDYFLIDDFYSSIQHKVECTSKSVFTPALVAEVQSVLAKYSREWEVIFAFPSEEGKDHALSVYATACLARDA